jgi:ketosteroid isomerase-like protein
MAASDSGAGIPDHHGRYWSAMSEENVEVARQILGAWNSGDIEGAVEVLDPDCVIDVTARVFNPETYVGHEGFRRFALDVGNVWQRFGFDARDLLSTGEYVVALGASEAEGRGSGIRVGEESAWVFTIRDGLVTEGRLFYDPAEALDAAGIS